MYRNRKKTNIYILSAALLCVLAFTMAAWGAEVPGGGSAVDGTLYDADASDISKGSLIVSAPDVPDGSESNEKSQNFRKSDGPVSSEAPRKFEAPQSSDNIKVSAAPAGVSTESRSPVILCGNGKSSQKTETSAKKKDDTPMIISLGMFTTTGYCNCEKCSTGYGLTYSGTVPKARHTVAADISLYPIGTKLRIDGITYTVEDIGSAVVGNHIDVYYDDHETALAHGRQTQEVFLAN